MTNSSDSRPGWVLGVDSGGSGLRVALAPVPSADDTVPTKAGDRADTAVSRQPVRTGPGGIDAGHLMEQLVPMAKALLGEVGGDGEIRAVAIGAAGMATLGDELRDLLPDALAEAFGVRRLALAADAVTAYTGALGQRPGAVVAAGTGMIALGTEGKKWRRADGWGHLLGDCGGGAWIGRAGLDAALRDHDGRRGGSAALRARAEEFFDGPVTELPGKLYPRTDRPAVLASFVPEVARCAAEDDPVAVGILRAAALHIAEAAAAVCPPETECEVALTGGLFGIGDLLLVPLKEELSVQLPRAQAVSADGNPLEGAVVLATALALDALALPCDGRLLHVPEETGGAPTPQHSR
ncbi:ATPase [Streptomyces sp. YC504]|uniref:ATPase n=1 Tax=Streptomyces mesophilus TaxID=1775132 RepID=A0A6G4XQB9_9ACTN|nr:BadF/BadG/BcrA/BcrD ATPase family protein [Streptomyces mesophilus]NGO79628.1 ATPase [Streptomyces mesophilus]